MCNLRVLQRSNAEVEPRRPAAVSTSHRTVGTQSHLWLLRGATATSTAPGSIASDVPPGSHDVFGPHATSPAVSTPNSSGVAEPPELAVFSPRPQVLNVPRPRPGSVAATAAALPDRSRSLQFPLLCTHASHWPLRGFSSAPLPALRKAPLLSLAALCSRLVDRTPPGLDSGLRHRQGAPQEETPLPPKVSTSRCSLDGSRETGIHSYYHLQVQDVLEFRRSVGGAL
ncbi:hypothetical protein NDU88_005828 [Pleurodeles waltl]|uniref:Uncharacterized protein n=1 Tax=Pleurodeles waltl TaxID=8319 RepID=A0AAV7VK47_PLEWA|nr:hypothetical protein NDU88_005828 [Pleurodeles waltl]